MPNKSKAENDAALRETGIPRRSFSKPEFCARNNLSPGLLKKLEALGLGPRVTPVLDRLIITIEDETAWLQMMKERDAAAKRKASVEKGSSEKVEANA